MTPRTQLPSEQQITPQYATARSEKEEGGGRGEKEEKGNKKEEEVQDLKVQFLCSRERLLGLLCRGEGEKEKRGEEEKERLEIFENYMCMNMFINSPFNQFLCFFDKK